MAVQGRARKAPSSKDILKPPGSKHAQLKQLPRKPDALRHGPSNGTVHRVDGSQMTCPAVPRAARSPAPKKQTSWTVWMAMTRYVVLVLKTTSSEGKAATSS